MIFRALCGRANNVLLVKLIVRCVRQVASHLVIKNKLEGIFRGLSGKRGGASVIGWEWRRSETMQRAVCCSNGSTGGDDQKTAFPWGHGVPVCEWGETLLCFVESFVVLFEGCNVCGV
jgi:hypothetical protein